ncbi:hypothetical protein DACRYDRAFT_99944 [Dacryopinax primogenitus]|uniref:CUE domain-containing protein n=1 Tax=Dacryopinax primogenitus (strain DJM 731) TaxID=1858805 RepID=M5G240_DACPD|nr:uncharacterized protein DACRYDRAFT_99944 [Dacryopinax primogenitus]EJU02280.1 hypothetical protein DACRYDRAFT_99944 [Dacryopinax primogenitus]
MTSVSIPLWPTASTKGKIPSSRWESAVNSFVLQLGAALSTPDARSISQNCMPFLTSYLHEEASGRLRQLDSELPSDSAAEFVLRKRAFEVLRRIASVPGTIDPGLLMDAAVVYEGSNHTAMVSLVDEALTVTPALSASLRSEVIPAFVTMLPQPNVTTPALLRSSICLIRLLNCGSSMVDVLSDNQLILAIAKAYNNTPFPSVESEQLVLQAKANLLDSFRTLIYARTSAARHQRTKREGLYELLYLLHDLAPPTSPPDTQHTASSSLVARIQAPILAVYESMYGLSKTLEAMGLVGDATRKYMVQTLKGLRIPGLGQKQVTQPTPPAGLNGSGRNSNAKGKGRSQAPGSTADETPELELKLTQVLDILPDESPDLIRACLRHPPFGGSVEQVVAALLEGNIPAEVRASVGSEERKDAFPLLESRRNVFDDDPLDFSKLRIGKNRDNADGVLRNRAQLDAVKADILRRVQDMSDSEEEDAEAEGRKIVAFEEELDDGMEPSSAVKVTNDGEESEEGDDMEDGEPQSAKKVDVETLLEQTYIRDPKLFDRDAATRRTKQRADLRAQTGWSDEQLEGWRIMLERNQPRKDKILQKHEFSGNRPLVPEDEGQPSSSHASDREGQSSHQVRGRGGRGGRGQGAHRGGGGEGRGGSNSARDRAWKDKNKARQGNHDRKRGHDKKLARAAGPPASDAG